MADIGEAVGMRGPSLYKHVESKQEILARIMVATMEELLAAHHAAASTTQSPVERLRRATEAHVRYHAEYETCFRRLVQAGVDAGVFTVTSAGLASYAILDLGMGVSAWYREAGEHSEDTLVWQYGEFALRLVGARP